MDQLTGSSGFNLESAEDYVMNNTVSDEFF